jgi:hypothetical protein
MRRCIKHCSQAKTKPLFFLPQVVPRDYDSHRQLLQMMAEEGLVLDGHCGAETF